MIDKNQWQEFISPDYRFTCNPENFHAPIFLLLYKIFFKNDIIVMLFL